MYTFFTRGVVPKAAPAAISPDDGDGDSGGDGGGGLGVDGGGAGGAGEQGRSGSPSHQLPRMDPSSRGLSQLRSSSPAEPNVTELMARLQRAEGTAKTEPYKSKWFDESGSVKSCTVIQEDLFTESTGLYKGLENILYFYHKCVLKVSCEAVCEGAGGVNNKHAGKRRSSISPEHVELEAFIDYNGPAFAEADDFLRGALNRHFKRMKYGNGEWHFFQTSRGGQRGQYSERSKVLQRLDGEVSKLTCMRKAEENK